jgi:hypothetical protein
MVGDAREHVAQLGFGIKAVQSRRADQAVERRSAFATCI